MECSYKALLIVYLYKLSLCYQIKGNSFTIGLREMLRIFWPDVITDDVIGEAVVTV